MTRVPTSEMQITAAVGYLDASYSSLDDSVITNPTPVFLENELVAAPECSANVGAAYSWTIGDLGTPTPRIDWSYRGSSFNDAVNTPQLKQDSYHLLNASLVFDGSDGHWQAVLAGNNLTDETYLVTGISAFDTAASYLEGIYGRPAEWSLRVKYSFF